MTKENSPFVCFASPDAEAARMLALPVDCALIDDDLTLRRVGRRADGPLDPAQIAYGLGVVALSKDSLRLAQAWRDEIRVRSGQQPPRILDLSEAGGGAPDSLSIAINAMVVQALLEERAGFAKRCVDLNRQLSTLRETHESTQAAFQGLEGFFHEVVKSQRWDSIALEPVTGRPSVELGSGAVLTQDLPCGSVGLSDVAVWINNGTLPRAGVMQVSLETLEDERVVATWTVQAQRLATGWNRFAMPKALGPDAMSVRLRVEWQGTAPLTLRSSIAHPDTRFRARLDDAAGPAAIALKTWKYVAGASAAMTADSHPASAANVRTWLLSPGQMATTVNVDVSRFDVRYLDEHGVLLVHPVANGVAAARIEGGVRAGVSEIQVSIETASESGPTVEYSIAAVPVSERPTLAGAMPRFRPEWHSEWIGVGPLHRSTVPLFLPTPSVEPMDLYFLTRMPTGGSDPTYAWATFSDVTLRA
jgi:hypothetical protein